MADVEAVPKKRTTKSKKRHKSSLDRSRKKRYHVNHAIADNIQDVGDWQMNMTEPPISPAVSVVYIDSDTDMIEVDSDRLKSAMVQSGTKKTNTEAPRTNHINTKEMDQSEGCLDLEIPLTTLQRCCDLAPGKSIRLTGNAKTGGSMHKSIEMKSERKENSVCFQLFSSTMGPVFKTKLEHYWKCAISDALVSPEVHTAFVFTGKPENKDKSKSKESRSETNSNGLPTEDSSKFEQSWNEADNDPESFDLFVMDQSDGSDIHPLESNEVQIAQEPQCDGSHLLGEISTDVNNSAADDNAELQAYMRGKYDDMDATAVCRSSQNKTTPGQSGTIEENGSDLDEQEEEEKNSTGIECRFCGKSLEPFTLCRGHETQDCSRNPWSKCSLQPKPGVSATFPIGCKFCGRGFIRKSSCTKHEESCARDPAYMDQFDKDAMGLHICDICDIMTLSEMGLSQHKGQYHGFEKPYPAPRRKSTPVNCRFCNMLLPNHSRRNDHEHFQCHENPDVVVPAFCKQCGHKCDKDKLETHMAKHEMEEHICDVCGLVCVSKRRLTQHRQTHRDITDKYQCPDCKKLFRTRDKLQRHSSIHSEYRKVQCDICLKFFKNKAQETSHRTKVHENRYKFKCEKCGHGMSKQSYLDAHKCGRVRRVQNKSERSTKNSDTQDNGVTVNSDGLGLDLSENNFLGNDGKAQSIFQSITSDNAVESEYLIDDQSDQKGTVFNSSYSPPTYGPWPREAAFNSYSPPIYGPWPREAAFNSYSPPIYGPWPRAVLESVEERDGELAGGQHPSMQTISSTDLSKLATAL